MQLTNYPGPTPLETKLGLRAIETDFPDMQISRLELRRGVHEFSTRAKNNPEVMKYFGAVRLPKAYLVDETPWCAIYESWIDLQSGCTVKPSTAAVDFAHQGSPVEQKSVQYGDRCVRSRTGGHHVHRFVAHADDGGYWALGGNQSNSVCIAHYTWDAVIAVNRPVRPHSTESASAALPAAVLTTPASLKRGSAGLQVRSLQHRLNELGLNAGTEDGVFFLKTEAAVKAFQKANGLKQDGVVGPKTAAALAPKHDENEASQPSSLPVTNPTPAAPNVGYGPLPWENVGGKVHGERTSWSHELESEIAQMLPAFDKAKDRESFHKNYDSLTPGQRVRLWATAMVEIARYECDFNPASAGVDVGKESDKDTWSVGLFQLSVVDQANYGIHYGYDFQDLKDPSKNIKLAMAIVMHWLQKDGVVSGGVKDAWKGMSHYWSTARETKKLPAVKAVTNALKF